MVIMIDDRNQHHQNRATAFIIVNKFFCTSSPIVVSFSFSSYDVNIFYSQPIDKLLGFELESK